MFKQSLILVTFYTLAANAFAAAPSVVDVHYLSDLSSVPGASSSLVRTPNGVSMTVNTNDLPEGAYTNWWIVFNDPSACTNPIPLIGAACGVGDLGNQDVQASVLYATGNVVDTSGVAGFSAHLSEGDTQGALFGPGLIDSEKAEIHIIVRHHGEMLPAFMPAQIQEINGGCFPAGPNPPCTDPQAAAHAP